ncbi:MAG: hypothetical protein HY801_01625 [Candidatus Lindowbacteria bacterium]|nr:hypothetical protein [Candidatus Lindowbacteria bacterium]
MPRASEEDIARAADKAFEKEPMLARNVKIYLCHGYTGQSLKAIGAKFGTSESGASQACRRMILRMKHDSRLRKRVDAIRDSIGLSSV